MKRASTKKIKAAPACAANNGALEEIKPVQPKLKRRVTSVAMIGLAISMGSSSLLLVGQSAQTGAVEPTSQEPTASNVPAAPVVVGKSINSVEPEVVKSLPKGTSSTVMPPAPRLRVQLKAAVSTPGLSRTERKAQLRQTLRKLAANRQVAINNSATALKQPDAQAHRNSQVNRLVQKLKTRQAAKKLYQSYAVNHSQITPVTGAVEPLPVQKSLQVNNQVNSPLQAKQRLLINRLKQHKENQLNNTLASKSEELNNQASPSQVLSPDLEQVQSIHQERPAPRMLALTRNWRQALQVSPEVATSNDQPSEAVVPETLSQPPSVTASLSTATASEQQAVERLNQGIISNNQQLEVATETPLAAANPEQLSLTPLNDQAEVEQPAPSSQVVTGNESLLDNSELQQAPDGGIASQEINTDAVSVIPPIETEQLALEQVASVAPNNENLEAQAVEIPTIPVNEPTVVAKLIVPQYQVKPGDTLTAIARNYGLSVYELVHANGLSNPNQIEVNQRLRVPQFKYNIGADKIAVIEPVSLPPITVSNQAIPTKLQTVSSNNLVPVVPASSQLPTSEQLQPNVIAAETSSRTLAQDYNYSGMGGSISDEAEAINQPAADSRSQLDQVATKPQPELNQYAQELQTDIDRLRQKYYAQQTVSQVLPIAQETAIASKKVVVNPPLRSQVEANQPINPEFRMAQAINVDTSQPLVQKSYQIPTSRVPARPKARVATVQTNVDASTSLQSWRGRTVSPELPPLGAVDTYLSNPSTAPLKGYIWPSKGVLTSGYGWRWGRMHKGIDIAAPIGTPIVAAAPGVVVRAGWNKGGYGKLVDIQHTDGTVTRYAHNNRILVQAGQIVDQGQQISEMGSTGFSTGPHLHFEVHPGGKGAVNPIALLPSR